MAADRRRPFWYIRRRRDTVASEVDEELNLHLQMRIEELEARGLPSDAARDEALRQFGDLEATRSYCREQDEAKEQGMQRSLMLADLVQDLQICFRGLRRAPMMTIATVGTVGLGIGATAAIFSAVHAALLRPLPYGEPDRLVRFYTDNPPFKFRFSLADYFALRDQQTHFETIAAYTERAMSYSADEIAELVRGRIVSWPYFSLLGIRPALVRDFTESDGRPGSPPTVMVSHAFWQQRLGSRTDAIGQPLRLDGSAYTLVGVLPPAVGPLEEGQEFFAAAQWTTPPRRGPFFYTVRGRLRSNANRAAAESELREINRRIFPLWKASYQDDKATWTMTSLKEFIVGDFGTVAGLALALAAVGLVWLIACANASNLLIARVTSRRQELGVRAALGASRGRVVRYLLAESALLAVGSVILGMVLACVGMELLRDVGANYFPRTRKSPSMAQWCGCWWD